MKNTKIVHIITVALAIVAMALPYGAICRFITPSENGVQHETLETYSYFDPLPYGYGNVWPLLTAILTTALFILIAYTFFGKEKKGLQIAFVVLSSAALVLSLLPLILYGFKFFNMTALTISYLLVCSVVMSVQRLMGRYFCTEDEEETA